MKYLILEKIRSAYNVGAIFRTADAAGVQKIFLVGYTPTPVDRFGRLQMEIQKTSLGASTTVAWEHRAESLPLIQELQADGIKVVVVEQSAAALTLAKFVVPTQVAYVLGNEIDGVAEVTRENADTIVEIPMLGKKESLNVSVAAGIILYHSIVT